MQEPEPRIPEPFTCAHPCEPERYTQECLLGMRRESCRNSIDIYIYCDIITYICCDIYAAKRTCADAALVLGDDDVGRQLGQAVRVDSVHGRPPRRMLPHRRVDGQARHAGVDCGVRA